MLGDGEPVQQNLTDVVQKLCKVCENWLNRKLTLTGKVLLVNSLMGSLFVYKMQNLINFSHEQLKLVERIIQDFLWDYKKPKISMSTLCKKNNQFGMKLVNIHAKQKAVKILWIFQLNKNEFLSECAYAQLNPVLRELIWQVNLNKADLTLILGREYNFWTQILEAWCELNYTETITEVEMIRKQILWFNSCIRIGNKPVIWKDWIDKGIMYIKDIVTDTGEMANFADLNIDWFKLNMLYSATPTGWKQVLKNADNQNKEWENLYEKLSKGTKITKIVYEMLIDDENHWQKYWNRWSALLQPMVQEEVFKTCFINLPLATKIVKFRDFQYRLLLGKIITNRELYKWKWIESDRCTFCEETIETYSHLFYDCKFVKPLINWIAQLCVKQNIPIELNATNLIFNTVIGKPTHIINFVTIFIKQYVYRQCCKKVLPCVSQMKQELETCKNGEIFMARRDGNEAKMCSRWSPINVVNW